MGASPACDNGRTIRGGLKKAGGHCVRDQGTRRSFASVGRKNRSRPFRPRPFPQLRHAMRPAFTDKELLLIGEMTQIVPDFHKLLLAFVPHPIKSGLGGNMASITVGAHIMFSQFETRAVVWECGTPRSIPARSSPSTAAPRRRSMQPRCVGFFGVEDFTDPIRRTRGRDACSGTPARRGRRDARATMRL